MTGPGTKIHVGDCLEVLRAMPPESVHCVITSPPYWGLRAYKGDPGMIGMECTFEEHIENLVRVFGEVRRVLRKDGTFWLNYGDCYHSGDRGGFHKDHERGLTGGKMQLGNKGSLDMGIQPNRLPQPGLKNKDLMLMHARLALALQDDGWWLRQMMPWLKRNSMPESTSDRPTNSLEFVYLLTRSGDPLYWTHPEKPGTRSGRPEPEYVWKHKVTGDETRTEPPGWREDKDWKRINLWTGHDYFYDGAALRQEKAPDTEARYARARSDSHKWENGGPDGMDQSITKSFTHMKRKTDKQRGHGRRHAGFNDRWDSMTKEEQQACGRSFRNSDLLMESIREPWGLISDGEFGLPLVIDVSPKGYSGAHFATFPPQLIGPFIKAGTSEHGVCTDCAAPWSRSVVATTGWAPTCDCGTSLTVPATVLDNFGGAGTVGLVANRLGRQAILVEINAEYAQMAEHRILDDGPLFAQVEVG